MSYDKYISYKSNNMKYKNRIYHKHYNIKFNGIYDINYIKYE